MKPIRVLCVFSTLDRGGAETMCMNLYRHIDRRNVQFDFVKHTQETGDFENEIVSLGGKIYAAPRYKVYNHLAYTMWWESFLGDHPEYKIVHGHFFTIASVYLEIAQKKRRYTIGHIHASDSGSGLKGFLKDLNLSKVGRIADKCFACSEESGKWAYKHQPFSVLKNAIDTELFRFDSKIRNQMRADLNIANEFVVGVVGSIYEVKNPMGVLDIFENILEKNPSSKLLWIGDGSMREKVEERVLEANIQNQVILTGVRSDVNALMQAMDVFILPSFSEGLPVVSIEAQASGLPCFLSDTITQEVNITGLCHFLPIDDYLLWAKTICDTNLLSRRDTSQQIIDAGYDIHTTAKWLENFYLRIANNVE